MENFWKSEGFLILIISLCVWPTIASVIDNNVSEEIPSEHRSAVEEAEAVKQLLVRLIPEKAHEILIEVDYEFHNKDAFQV
ncbi:hypothetical protein CEXT_134181 [Caerostris extrusa]|uniref:Uncharacterized protein n=1 Tax=Caerostris extrusa TaxID=172846 RepID=A0AAV4PUP0_CAEEX|nr:hypothetical protein CEXT_134181 [Caerostris extrusa]